MSGKVSKIFGLAAERDLSTGSIVFVSAKNGIEFDVKESCLNGNAIQLGNFYTIDIVQEKPEGIRHAAVDVVGDKTFVSDIIGTRRFDSDTGCDTYETKEFGSVVCLDPDSANEGSQCPIIISRLPIEKRQSLYKNYFWGANVDPKVCHETSLADQMSELKVSKDGSHDGKDSDTDVDLEESGMNADESKEIAASSGPSRNITGFISGVKNMDAMMTCNLTWPGRYINIVMRHPYELKIGDWVNVSFSDSDFKTFFPHPAKRNTRQFTTSEYKKELGPRNYRVTLDKKDLKVTITGLRLSVNHKTGKRIEDPFMGTVIDRSKKVPNGPCSVDLVIRRDTSGKQTTWEIIQAEETKKVISSEEEEDEEDEEEEEYEEDEEEGGKEIEKRKEERKKLWKEKRLGERRVLSKDSKLSAKRQHPTYPAKTAFLSSDSVKPTNYRSAVVPNYYPKSGLSAANNNPRFFTPARYQHPIIGPGFREEQPDLVKKIALVTSVTRNKTESQNDMIAWLWLIDDHVPSKYFYSSDNNLQIGHFFLGMFLPKAGGKFDCVKYIKSQRQLMPGCLSKGTIELKVYVSDYFPANETRKYPETSHPYIGRIVDNTNCLPTEFSGRIQISIKLVNRTGTNQYWWVVKNSFQHKHFQLLSDFYKVWHTPGIAHVIDICCRPEFLHLEELYKARGGDCCIATLMRDKKKREAEKEQTNAKNAANGAQGAALKTSDHKGNFALTTVVDDDFVRMTVFPRGKDQKMGDMKKNVTNKKIYAKVKKLEAHKLYRVELDDKGDVVAMKDCRQYFSVDKNGHVELTFTTVIGSRLAKNVGLGKPIGMPKWLGNLMFHTDCKISNSRSRAWKGVFRLLNDSDRYVDDEESKQHGVSFMSAAVAEKVEGNDKVTADMDEAAEEELDIVHFKTQLQNMPRESIFQLYKKLRIVLNNKNVLEKLEENEIDIDFILRLDAYQGTSKPNRDYTWHRSA